MTEFAKSDEDRQVLKLFSTDVVIGRPFVTSPGVPAERVALLRKAFDEMMTDPAYLDDSKKAALDVTPVAGAKVQAIVADLVHTPADIVAKAKLAMEPSNTVERPK
jgi:tripartite-type tricarboxylate transporter receptor subunit TctC